MVGMRGHNWLEECEGREAPYQCEVYTTVKIQIQIQIQKQIQNTKCK